MKYVLDASVGLKTVLPENDSASAITLIADFLAQVHELIAPDTYLVECAHALTRSERRGIIQPSEAFEKFTMLADAVPKLHSHIPLLTRDIELSSSIRHGVYDCLYVALAEREACNLVTADEKLVKNLRGFPIVSLTSV